MGALTAAAPYLPIIKEGLTTITGAVSQQSAHNDAQKQQQVALRQLQATQRLNQQNAAADAALQSEKLAADAATAENMRVAALRRAVARQRANFGAQGIGSDGGSSGAVLFGLYNESDAERAQREQIDALRNRSLDLGLSQQQALNTLQYSQLQERQKIGKLTTNVDRVGGLLGSGLDLLGTAGKVSQLF